MDVAARRPAVARQLDGAHRRVHVAAVNGRGGTAALVQRGEARQLVAAARRPPSAEVSLAESAS